MTNSVTSVQQRLRNAADGPDRPPQDVLQYYGMEHCLYRLSQSRYADRFPLRRRGAVPCAGAGQLLSSGQ